MKIADFELLIQELPFRNQSFDIKRSNWKCENQKELIDRVFGEKDIVTVNRYDLINSSFMEEFIIKTLMWGYPTKGRGNNINNLLKPENFEKLSENLKFRYTKNYNEMYSLLIDNQPIAIKRAKELYQKRSSSPANDNPSTTVFKLVEELNKYINDGKSSHCQI